MRNDEGARALEAQLQALARRGLNALVLEINHSFEFASHPELRTESYVHRTQAKQLAAASRAYGIRPIPLFNCLGHQSWAKSTFPLLTQYPELDETPGQFPENKDIYCRSWCPQHPGVNPIIFALINELIDVFAADAFHVGTFSARQGRDSHLVSFSFANGAALSRTNVYTVLDGAQGEGLIEVYQPFFY